MRIPADAAQPLTASKFAQDNFNIEIGRRARFDAFTPVHFPLPSRLNSLSAGFPARRIRQRRLSSFSLGNNNNDVSLLNS
jgi:hypothetical protein